jgi:hypothetical protein
VTSIDDPMVQALMAGVVIGVGVLVATILLMPRAVRPSAPADPNRTRPDRRAKLLS